jgi:hypothetical protein
MSSSEHDDKDFKVIYMMADVVYGNGTLGHTGKLYKNFIQVRASK